MIEKDLKFLDFILPILSEMYPQNKSITYLSRQYGRETNIKYEYNELKILVDENEYLVKETPMYSVRIDSDWKAIIDIHGSLSKYLEFENEKIEVQNKKQNEIEALNKKISELSITNLELQNRQIKTRIIYSIIGAIGMLVLSEWRNILEFLKGLTLQ